MITNFFLVKNFLRSEINYNQNNILIRPSTTLCAEKNIVEAIKKFKSFFFANLEFLGKKTCVRTSRRASFEDSLQTSVFTCLQKLGIFSAEKKSIFTEKDFERQWITKKPATTFGVVVVGKTCGETFELVRFHGAVCGVRERVRVRFTCGQDFARTAGSAFTS